MMMGCRVLVLSFLSVTVCGVVFAEECKDEKCTSRTSTNDILLASTTEEVETHTTSLLDKPKSMNMLAEDVDHSDHSFLPTALPSTDVSPKTTKPTFEEPKGRALNFSVGEHHTENVLSNTTTKHGDHDGLDLSDVTIGEDDEDMEMLTSKILAPTMESKNSSLGVGICEKGGLTYENGEKLTKDCDSVCTCRNGKMDCEDRCIKPFYRKGKQLDDPLCSSKDTDDPCCSIMVCAGDTETEPLEMCTFGNKTYNRGQIFEKECSEVCTCEAGGKIACKPRCFTKHKSKDRCVELPDPNDPCCTTVFCDVTLDENEPEKDDERIKRKLISAKYINDTTILVKFDTKFDDPDIFPTVELSNDQNNWKENKILPGGYLHVNETFKYLKLEHSDDIITIMHQKLMEAIFPTSNETGTCQYKGRSLKIGEEYNDQCNSLCVCKETGMNCLKLQCPTYFGVDVLDPNCVEWETEPPNFNPTPPNCCPDSIRCKNNGSCLYEGKSFKNWEQLPINVTGCEKRCYCEMSKVECQNTCPPVTALPPPTLPCAPHDAIISHLPDDDCCKHWICDSPRSQSNGNAIEINKHISENWQQNKDTTNKYLIPFTPKPPSKVFGPLAIYQNEDSKNVTENNLGVVQKPTITSTNENPYYHQQLPYPNSDVKTKKSKDKSPNYINPSKPDKSANKKTAIFVTPPPQQFNENNIPSSSYQKPIPTSPQDVIKSEFEVHGHGNPEELLQFINQHPEISNYPSGSVLEIHKVPVPVAQNPINIHSNPKSQIHLVPYVVPTNAAGEPNHTNLPPGFSLEQILNEFHKNSQPQPHIPLVSPFVGSNGPVIIPQQTGSVVFDNKNSTKKDYGTHPFLGNFPSYQQPQDTITIHTLEAVDAHTVRLAFMVPRVIVGLHGSVEVRYTHDQPDDDLDAWMLQVFAPPNDLIATPSLEFDLQDLRADTEYKFKITITLRDVQNTHSSAIYRIKTPKDVHTTTLPPLIPIEPNLEITDINSTWVTVGWRKFTEYELQFIDGVQLRYKEIDGKIYAASPLIHRAVTSYVVENLKPNTKYEIGIFFIPFPGQTTELHAANMLHFTTANLIDTYGFNVTLVISQVKTQTVEISWSGVPYPEDKYVNIYRAIYQSDSGKEDHSTFKIAKRDSPTKTIIMDLKPGTRYRIWLEVYLTNGKIKMSNVQDFFTKPRAAPSLGSTQQDKLSREESLEAKGDYYGPLVIVAILASIAILSTLILLLILVRRHNQNKAAITPPSTRVSQSAYDNPTYKVEIQQETMGL